MMSEQKELEFIDVAKLKQRLEELIFKDTTRSAYIATLQECIQLCDMFSSAVFRNPLLNNLKCPECGDRVFYANMLPSGWVMCRDMGHWVGPVEECSRITYEVEMALGAMESRARASEQELKRVRKLLKKALGTNSQKNEEQA